MSRYESRLTYLARKERLSALSPLIFSSFSCSSRCMYDCVSGAGPIPVCITLTVDVRDTGFDRANTSTGMDAHVALTVVIPMPISDPFMSRYTFRVSLNDDSTRAQARVNAMNVSAGVIAFNRYI